MRGGPSTTLASSTGCRLSTTARSASTRFLDLNEQIGGFDEHGHYQSERTVGDLEAIRLAYETGRLTNGGGGLAVTPVIDYRGYSDDREDGDVHVRYHSFSMRERLRAANGHTDNHVMLVEDDRYGLYSSDSPVLQEALLQMDRWLEALAEDTSSDAQIDKVRRAKPATLVDACWTRDDDPTKVAEPQVRGEGRCEELYPSAPAPREVAGAPLSGLIVKCQLKPIDTGDYDVDLTAEQRARLEAIFAEGVCDWSKPGAGHAPLRGTWLSAGSET